MKFLNHEEDEMELIISYESQKVEKIKCKMSEKIEDILTKFANKINVDYSSFMILYSGKALVNNDLKCTFFQVMSTHDKIQKSMSILIYTKATIFLSGQVFIKILLIINSTNVFELKGKKNESIKSILKRNQTKIGKDIDSLIIKYGNDEIDINKKFDDIANETDKKFSGITLSAYSDDSNYPITVVFEDSNNKKEEIDCYIEDKIEDICKIYCSRKNKSIKDFYFKYEIYHLDLKQNFKDYLQKIDNYCETNANNALNKTIKKYNVINIKVFDQVSCFKKNKIKILIILSIAIILIIALIVILLCLPKSPNHEPLTQSDKIDTSTIKSDIIDTSTEEISGQTEKPKKICDKGYFIPNDDPTFENCQKCSINMCIKCKGTFEYNECLDCGELESVYDKNKKIIECIDTCKTGPEENCLTCHEDKIECKSCNVGYKLVNGKCRPDFLIKAVYRSIKDGDNIDLFNSWCSSRVNQMIIDGEKMGSKSEFKFPKKGNHTVYIKFNKAVSSPSETTSFFSNMIKLYSVTFSDFDEYLSDINFESLFYQCTNLSSVDLSKLSIKSNYKMKQMFYGCSNLTYVNLNFNQFIKPTSIEYMFFNCIKLTSIDMRKFNVSLIYRFNYMFAGCNKLKTVNLNSFELLYKSDIYIDHMFHNCFCLEYLDLSSFNPYKLKSMNSVFYNCRSLTSIKLENFSTNKVTDMEYLFFNCTSLKFIDISSFHTEVVIKMNSMFESCTSLTSILFGDAFITNKISNISAMFSHCHSLKYMNYPLSIGTNIKNLDNFFSYCYSLTYVNFTNFDTSNVNNYNYMFVNCYSLKNIDISNFKFTASASNTIETKYMFFGCYSLTSLNIISYEPKSFIYNGMFFDCPNLIYLNISCAKNNYNYVALFNNNVSNHGTIIINENLYNNHKNYLKIPGNWTIYYS